MHVHVHPYWAGPVSVCYNADTKAHTRTHAQRERGRGGRGGGGGGRARESERDRERERETHIHAHTQPLGKSNEFWRPVGWGGGSLRCFGDSAGALTRLEVDSALLVFLLANEDIILSINIACDMPTGGLGATGSCGATGTCRTAIPSGPLERIRSAAAIPSLRQDQRGEGKTCEKARSGEHASMHIHIPSQDAHIWYACMRVNISIGMPTLTTRAFACLRAREKVNGRGHAVGVYT
jgi:hypothetical protein